jgi:hypothetical protein
VGVINRDHMTGSTVVKDGIVILTPVTVGLNDATGSQLHRQQEENSVLINILHRSNRQFDTVSEIHCVLREIRNDNDLLRRTGC